MADSGSHFDEGKIPDEGFAVQRTPTVLILDTSRSMKNLPDGSLSDTIAETKKRRIDFLNEGMKEFKQIVKKNTQIEERVDIATVTFGGDMEVVHDFEPFTDWTPPKFEPKGTTPMAKAIDTAVGMTEEIKQGYREQGISYNRPLLWLITDGKPDMDEGSPTWRQIRNLLQEEMKGNHLALFPIGIDDTDVDRLNNLVSGTPVSAKRLDARKLNELFKFMSNSIDSDKDPINMYEQWDG